MKKILITLVVGLILSPAMSQQCDHKQYVESMEKALQTLDMNTTEAYDDAAYQFEQISSVCSDEWLPYYYIAFSQVNMAYDTQDKGRIDLLCDQAEHKLEAAMQIGKVDTSEVFCIKSLIATARIRVDFAARSMKYSMIARQYLEKAAVLNPYNPRVPYLQGQILVKAQEKSEGQKEKAVRLLLKASRLFDLEQNSGRRLGPLWGRDGCEYLLEQL